MLPTSSGRSRGDIIFDIASLYAQGQGFRFGPGAEGDIQFHANAAASEIDSLPNSEQTLKFKEAVNNFETVVDGMIEAAKDIPGYSNSHPDTIGEQTLREALHKLCPIWPFC